MAAGCLYGGRFRTVYQLRKLTGVQRMTLHRWWWFNELSEQRIARHLAHREHGDESRRVTPAAYPCPESFSPVAAATGFGGTK